MAAEFSQYVSDGVGFFLKSAAVAAGSALAGYCLRGAVDYYRMNKFKKVFGAGVKKADNLMISVPLWRALKNDRKVPRFLKADSSGTRAEYYGPDEMYNVDDMGAAAHVINVIGNHFTEPVTYTNDSIEADWKAKSVIIIGSPTANYHAEFYLTQFEARGTGAKLPQFIKIDEDEVTGARAAIKIPGEKEPRFSSSEEDYGVVLKMPNLYNREFNVFLIAGIHAPSTREAARFVRQLWYELLAKDVAAIVFTMVSGKEGTGRIIYEHKEATLWRTLKRKLPFSGHGPKIAQA
jgi:hypothetical protein